MIFYVAGGTGGHLYPAIAIYQELKGDSKFIVPRKLPAEKILSNYNIKPIISKFGKKEYLMLPYYLLKVLKIFFNHKPKMLIAMGGSVCIPYVFIAWLLNIPVFTFEQNSYPGRAVRVCQFFSRKIITSFEITKTYLVMKKRVLCLGNPIRTSYPMNDTLPKEWEALNGKTILVIGGSQGAYAINEFIRNNLENIMNRGWNIIHLTGDRYFQESPTFDKIISFKNKYYIALPFLNNMSLAFKKASLVICRSGATTLAEIRAYQLPAILIPYPYAKDNHQYKNAIDFHKHYSNVELIEQDRLTFENMLQLVHNLNIIQDSKLDDFKSTTAKYICEFIKTYLK